MRSITGIGVVLALCALPAVARPVLWYGLEVNNTTQNDIGTSPQANATLFGSAAMLYGSGPAAFSCACLDLSPVTTTGNSIKTASDVQKIDAMPALTMTMWINLRAAPASDDCLISDVFSGFPPADTGGWEVRIVNPTSGTLSASNFSLEFSLYRSMGGYVNIGGAVSTPLGASDQWVFIAVTYDTPSRLQRFYRGTETTGVIQFGYNTFFGADDLLRDNTASLMIGASGNEPAVERTPPAWIDDVRIHNTALTAAQLEQVRRENTQITNLTAVPAFFSIGDLPGLACSCYANSVSADGTTVVGRGTSTNGIEAFRWRDGVFTPLGDLPGGSFASIAQGVSADGSTVVGVGRTAETNSKAFRWKDGTLLDLGDLPGGDVWSTAYGVSADGNSVAGYSMFAAPSGYAGFLWSGGLMSMLSPLPGGDQTSAAFGISEDGSVIVGVSAMATGYEAVRWDNGVISSLGDLPGGAVGAHAYRVAAAREVVVGDGRSDAGMEAALWRGGRVWGLGDLPGGPVESQAWGVTAHGSLIVGTGMTGTSTYEAFIWDRVNGMRSLLAAMQNDYGLDTSWWTLTWATGVSRDGSVVVAYGRHPAGYVTSIVFRRPRLPAIADFDGDNDVDNDDLDRFAACASGAGVPYVPLPAGCQMAVDTLGLIRADLDWDGDVDMDDFGRFQLCVSGHLVSPPEHCRG